MIIIIKLLLVVGTIKFMVMSYNVGATDDNKRWHKYKIAVNVIYTILVIIVIYNMNLNFLFER